MALRQTLRARPLTANFGLAAAVGISATLLYTYTTAPSPTTFGTFRPRHLRLESVQDLSHNIKRLRFALPNPNDLSGLPLTSAVLTASWPPGHALPVLRPYSPVSLPSSPGHVDLVVKRYPHGKQSTHLHSLAPGDSLLFVTKLPGYAWEPEAFGRVTLVAGGAGITPCFQLLRGIVEGGERTQVELVYGVEGAGDAVLRGELEGLVGRAGGRVGVTVVSRELDGVGEGEGEGKGLRWREGRVTRELLGEVVGEGRGREGEMVFVCGPPGMEEALVRREGRGKGKGILEELGYAKEQVHRF